MAVTTPMDRVMGLATRQDTFNRGGLFGGLGGGGLSALDYQGAAQARAQDFAMAEQQRQMMALAGQPPIPKIVYKPTIEAGDPIIDVLQAETDEWLRDI